MFSPITSRDFSLHEEHDTLVQNPVVVPYHEFQHSSDFDHYRPCKFDYFHLDAPANTLSVLRSDLANSIWESLKMKQHYILAAANEWNGDTATSPLPSTIPEDKLREINMVPPVFPTLHQFLFNPFLITGHPDIINAMIAAWQEHSCRLATWISKAKLNSSNMPNCSWTWPSPPSTPYHSVDSSVNSGSTDVLSPSTEVKSDPGESTAPTSHAVHAFRAQATLVPLKRTHNTSPLNSERDGTTLARNNLCFGVLPSSSSWNSSAPSPLEK